MKSVLISTQPRFCEMIASGKETLEVRKTKPKLDTPFKCYIYCTKDKKQTFWAFDERFECESNGNGKVIGEFICDRIFPISVFYSNPNSSVALKEFPYTGLTDREIIDYLGNGKSGFGWRISNLVIYDEPKELSDFYRRCEKYCCENCGHLKYQTVNGSEYDYDCEFLGQRIPITQPPQSWCYVEDDCFSHFQNEELKP